MNKHSPAANPDRSAERPITLVIPIGRIVRILIATACLLIVADIVVQILHYYGGFNQLLGLYNRFDVNSEGNFPTYFSGILLLVAASLLSAIAAGAAGHKRKWYLLSLVFVYLSVDEIARVHELVSLITAHLMNITGDLKWYVWLIPFAVLVPAVVAIFIPFVKDLAQPHRGRFVVAGLLYVGGAAGFEFVAALYSMAKGNNSFAGAMLNTVEESMEMAGVIVFVWALLCFLKARTIKATVSDA